MRYEIVIIIWIIVFVIDNIYKFKRIKRRNNIGKMKVDDRINELIKDFKIDIENNSELKVIRNKMRIIKIVKNIFYTILVSVLILAPFIYIQYKIGFKNEKPLIDKMLSIYLVFPVIFIILWWKIELYIFKKYQKSKNTFKEYIYNDFLKRVRYDIKWCDKSTVSEKTYKMWDTYINWKEEYKKANFNKIQSGEEISTNIFESIFSHPNEIYFEDHTCGIYKEKYIMEISDFREYMITFDAYKKRRRRLLYEGIFCIIKINRNILNDIRITNDKKYSFFMEKQYMVTTMPEEFYKNFIMLAKDGYKISEKISKKSIEIIEEFYNNSKIKFDISIKNDEIFFRFKTIDSMELNIWKNIVDDIMLKEYANIIMFITRLSEEINDNWR